jgi:uncharacterized membrane protein
MGYVWEMINQRVMRGKWRNVGFLYGPYQPIYGFAAVFLLPMINLVIDNPLLVFLEVAVVVTALELITGEVLSGLGFRQFWDYRESIFKSIRKTTYKGYISLVISVLWGLAALPLIYWVQPAIEKLTDTALDSFGAPLVFTLAVILIIDFVISARFNESHKKPESRAGK